VCALLLISTDGALSSLSSRSIEKAAAEWRSSRARATPHPRKMDAQESLRPAGAKGAEKIAMQMPESEKVSPALRSRGKPPPLHSLVNYSEGRAE
jgi:hypothetical protein